MVSRHHEANKSSFLLTFKNVKVTVSIATPCRTWQASWHLYFLVQSGMALHPQNKSCLHAFCHLWNSSSRDAIQTLVERALAVVVWHWYSVRVDSAHIIKICSVLKMDALFHKGVHPWDAII
jgi:hypothetical protein